MQRIVIISNYYPPEMGAAANRIKNLAEGLQRRGNDVTVICPLPNYPQGKIFKNYKNKLSVKENINNIEVKRFWIFPSKSTNVIARLLSMLSFSWSLWFSFFSFIKKKPDIFIIQSPPLFVALSGLLFSKFLGCRNILNVSDIWPLSALELGVIKKGVFYNLLEKIEKINYKLANKIIGQSNEIIDHISKLTQKDSLVYRNVSDYKEYSPKEKSNGNLKIIYAGLLGYAQGIFKVCEDINFTELNAELHIYGAGLEEEKIKELTNIKGNNIFFHGVKTSKEIKNEIRKYDVGFVPLKNRIYGAVPSKIFELMQLGVPILFFGEGEGELIVREEKIGFTCNSNDFKGLRNNILKYIKLNQKEYSGMTNRLLELHREEYNLEKQLQKLFGNNFLK
ncbi:glycosyltransferase family 4 protein [Polaribacter pectinis]|uniref:Glycosyltransferase family 4 protein n=1 Tax=Polaribacter pectinis TaxID=2738844 RepID=A0A7G9LCC8_9FLAO|nr:glycosyltransferase family 4 protein [Polaribacter pectinis]QNM86277.1 glycosyltransferase family 4 protein [Polaribacter pectinis]